MNKIGMYKAEEVFFDREKAANGCITIIGGSGYGKSTQGINLINQITDDGETVLALDIHSVLATEMMYKPLRENFEKNLHEINVYKDGLPCPLFTPMCYLDGETENSFAVIDSLTNILTSTFKFGVRQKSCLREALSVVQDEGLYDKYGFKALGGVLESFQSAKAIEVRERLSPLIDYNVFVPGDNFIKKGKINVIRLSKFSLDIQKVLSEVVLNFIWRQALLGKFKGSRLILYVDECHNMEMGKDGVIANILKEGRKFNLDLLLSTQVLSMDSDVTKLMLQSSLVMYFKPSQNEVKKIAGFIQPGNEEKWAVVLSELDQGSFIAKGELVFQDGVIYNKPLKLNLKI